MAYFHVISISLMSGGDHVVFTTFCGDYLRALLLCSMTHYNIIMGHGVAKDAPLSRHSG